MKKVNRFNQYGPAGFSACRTVFNVMIMPTKKKWSAHVTETSDALDLEKGVFTSGSPKKIAKSLERSAAKSKRRKGKAYQSAMSMLNFYINRAGKNLPASKKKVLMKAKDRMKADHEKEK